MKRLCFKHSLIFVALFLTSIASGQTRPQSKPFTMIDEVKITTKSEDYGLRDDLVLEVHKLIFGENKSSGSLPEFACTKGLGNLGADITIKVFKLFDGNGFWVGYKAIIAGQVKHKNTNKKIYLLPLDINYPLSARQLMQPENERLKGIRGTKTVAANLVKQLQAATKRF